MASVSSEASGMKGLLDWLKSLGIINASARKHYLQNEEEFVKDLCFKMILPKLAVHVDKRITSDMVRLGGMSALSRRASLEWKENIELFLSACKRLGIRKTFNVQDLDPKNEKVIATLFVMLQKLSTKIKSSYGPIKTVPKYHPRYSSGEEDLLDFTNHYDAEYEDGEEDEVYAWYIAIEDNSTTGLSKAVNELIKVEENYCKMFLGIMKNLITRLSSDGQLRKLLSNLKTDSLIPFHDQILDQLRNNGKNTLEGIEPHITDIFIRSKDDFIQYSHVIVRCRNLNNAFKLFEVDEQFSTEIAEMKSILEDEIRKIAADEMFDEELFKKRSSEISINSFLNRPFYHLVHYKNLAIRIHNETLMEIKSKGERQCLLKLKDSARKAACALHELLLFFNIYLSDADKRSTIRRIEARITNLSDNEMSLFHTYGDLHFERIATFKMESELTFKTGYIVCFQSMILFFEPLKHRDQEQSTRRLSFFRKSYTLTRNVQNLKFLKAISITSSMVVLEISSKRVVYIHIKSMHELDGSPMPKESFCIKTNTIAEAEEIKREFQKLVNRKAKTPKVDHINHNFEMFILPKVDSGNIKIPPKCGLCQMYLFGQLFTGYLCNNCKTYYHEECFIEGRTPKHFLIVDGLDVESDGASNPFPEEWILGRERDKFKLHGKEHGTFFVYPISKRVSRPTDFEEYRIVMVYREEARSPPILKKLSVKAKLFSGKKVYSLAQAGNTSNFSDLQSLVNAYKDRFDLKYPLFMDEAEEESSQNYHYLETGFGASNHLIDDGIPIFTKSHLNTSLLEGEPKGTYLVQKGTTPNEPYYVYVRRPSRKTGKLTTKKIIIESSGTKLQIQGNDHVFENIGDLVGNFKDKFQYPYNEQGNPLSKCDFYYDSIGRREAEKIVLSRQHNFILRKNIKGDFRLTAINKKFDDVIHFDVKKTVSGKFKISKFEHENIEELVHEFVENYYNEP